MGKLAQYKLIVIADMISLANKTSAMNIYLFVIYSRFINYWSLHVSKNDIIELAIKPVTF